MPTVSELQGRISIEGVEQSQRKLSDFGKSIDTTAGRAEKAGSRFASAGSTIGSAFTFAAGGLIAGGIASIGSKLAEGATSGLSFNSSMENVTAQLNAFTKDGNKSAEILDMIKTRASSTPFAFEEMAKATAGLLPAAKTSGVALEDLVKQAEILAASNPAQGLEGAGVALKEALSGDFTSIVERFNLPRQELNKLKAEGVPAMEAVSQVMQNMGLDASLVTNLAGTMTGRWSTFTDTLTGLAATASQPLFEGLSTGLGDLQGKLDANGPALQAFATVVGEKIGAAFQTVVGIIPTVVDGFNSIQNIVSLLQTGDFTGGIFGLAEDHPFINALFVIRDVGATAFDGFNQGATLVTNTLDGLRDIFSNVVAAFQTEGLGSALTEAFAGLSTIGENIWATVGPALTTVGTNILTWVTEQGPLLLEQFGTWAAGAGQWALDALPVLLGNLATLRENALASISESLPGWLAAFAEFAAPAAQWVLDAIPTVLDNLGTFAQAMIDQTMTYLPGWAATLAEYGVKAVSWIAERLPELANNLGEFGNRMINWVVDQLPTWGAKLGELGTKAAGWVLDALPGLATNLGTMAGNIISWVAQTAIDVVPKLAAMGVKFVGWVQTDVLPKLPGALETIAGALWKFVTATAAAAGPKLGELAAKFLGWVQADVIPYLSGKLDAIKTSISTWITGTAVPWAGKALASVGTAIIDGIKAGITAGVGALTGAIQKAAQDALDAAKAVLGINSPSLVFQLEVGQPIMAGAIAGIDAMGPQLVARAAHWAMEASAAANQIAIRPPSGRDIWRPTGGASTLPVDLTRPVVPPFQLPGSTLPITVTPTIPTAPRVDGNRPNDPGQGFRPFTINNNVILDGKLVGQSTGRHTGGAADIRRRMA